MREAKVLFGMLSSPEVNTIQLVNEEVVVVNWEYIEEVGEPMRNVNVVIAAYTTAQVRLKVHQ